MFSPDYYDKHGVLRLPWLFWAVLMLQARSWLLLVIAGVSREQGPALLALFYPEPNAFYCGLIAGLPAMGAFVLSGRRQRFPRCWQSWYWALIVAQLALLIWQGVTFVATPDGPGLALGVLDGVALAWLWTQPRLRAAFRPAAID